MDATGGSLKAKTMRDREAVNRFCAFAILGWKNYVSGDMDSFLADALDKMNKMTSAELNDLEARFLRAMKANNSLFKRHAFRKSLSTENDSDRSGINIALFEVCSVVLSSLAENVISTHSVAIRDGIAALLKDEDFNTAITYATNNKKRVENRFEKMETKLGEITR